MPSHVRLRDKKETEPADSQAEKPAWIVESCLCKKEKASATDGNRVPVKENTRGRMPGRAKDSLLSLKSSLAKLRVGTRTKGGG